MHDATVRSQLGSRYNEAFGLVRAFVGVRNAFGQHFIMIISNSKLALDTAKLLTNTTHAH